MIKELQEATRSFQALDEVFTSRTMEWMGALGITEQDVNEEMKRLRTYSLDQGS